MAFRVRQIATVAVLIGSASPALADGVPGSRCDLAFDAAMKTVNLDDPAVKLIYKLPTSDGSSIGIHIATGDGPPSASFVPTNTSSNPEAEVVAYRLARFLGVSDNFYPVDYYFLGPVATAKFRDMVFSTRETEDDRIANRAMVMKDLKAHPDKVLGIYRQKQKTKMYTVLNLGTEGEFALSAPLARALRANAAMPGSDPVSIPGVKGGRPEFPKVPTESMVELARELSTIFVVDQLLGQWDRFWGNLEASGDLNGRLKLVARDNGGATLSDWESYDDYSRWVTRFDRDLIDRLTALNTFLKAGAGAAFAGFNSAPAWKDAAGFRNDDSYEMFRKKLAHLIEKRVPALVDKHGDAAFFPPRSAEAAARFATPICDTD